MLQIRRLLKSARDILRQKAQRTAPSTLKVPPPLPSAWRQWADNHPRFTRAMRIIGIVIVAYLAMPYALIPVYRFIDPPFSSLMVRQSLNGVSIHKRWVDIDHISPSLVRSVILAEDASFCQHWGVDWGEVRDALARAKKGRKPRGASTLPMQTAKNLFLWPGQDYVRKALEVPIAYYMTLVLPKRRIAEIYLNIAEWGPGTFGIEAAARKYFKKSAARLTPMESALLAAALPNPRRRKANKPRWRHYRIATHIKRRTRREARDVRCVFK